MNYVTKDYINKKVYLIPEGNAISRRMPLVEQIQEVVLIKLSKKTAIVIENGSEIKIQHDELDIHNCGYSIYPSLEEAKGYFIINSLRVILSKFNYEMNLLQAKEIIEILKIKDINV